MTLNSRRLISCPSMKEMIEYTLGSENFKLFTVKAIINR